MPTKQRFRFENQDQLPQMDFLEVGELTELRNQGQQDEFFTLCHVWTAFLMAPQDQNLLPQEQKFEGFVIWGQTTEAQTIPE